MSPSPIGGRDLVGRKEDYILGQLLLLHPLESIKKLLRVELRGSLSMPQSARKAGRRGIGRAESKVELVHDAASARRTLACRLNGDLGTVAVPDAASSVVVQVRIVRHFHHQEEAFFVPEKQKSCAGVLVSVVYAAAMRCKIILVQLDKIDK